MIHDIKIDFQCTRLIEVLDYLKSIGKSQKEIAINMGVDTSYISHLRSGKLKHISQHALNGLKKHYYINPRYITQGALNMFDIAHEKYEYFEKFVSSWDLVNHGDKEYLHFTMDENFYNFLINVYNQKELYTNSEEQNMTETFQKSLELLKENFPAIGKSKKYVLIPADDDVIGIADGIEDRRNYLEEVIDILELHPATNTKKR